MNKKDFVSKKIVNHDNKKEENNSSAASWENIYQDDALVKPISVHSRTLVISLVMAVFFGFVAGLLSVLLFLSGSFSESKLFSWLDINSLLPTANVIIEKQEQTTVVEDERVQELFKDLSAISGRIMIAKKSIGQPEKDIYQPADFMANAFVLTSDGWLATGVELSENTSYVLSLNNKIFPITDIKRDENLGIVFIKITAENLIVTSFGQLAENFAGERVVYFDDVGGYDKKIFVSRLTSKNFITANNFIFNSEHYYSFLSLSDNLTKKISGAPVFNLNKDFIGLMVYKNGNYVVPADYIKKSLNQLTTLNVIKPTYLGIDFIDLSIAPGLAYKGSGALVTAIKKDSPIYQKLLVGDIIIKVGEDAIGYDNHLTNLIQFYRPGDKINLIILNKDNQEQTVEVLLK